jgi:hypothetical protein
MNPTARRIDQILTDTPLAATLLARLAAARQAARVIAPVCAEITPDFDPLKPGSCDLRSGVLRIWLRSSAHSTKLRQAIPRLLATLQRNNVEVSEIRVGVQPGRVREKPAGKPGNTDPHPRLTHPSSREEMASTLKMQAFSRKLALTLPNSELRCAITRFGQSIDAKLAQMRDSDQTFDEKYGKEQYAQAQPAEENASRPQQESALPGHKVQGNAGGDGRPEGKK